MLESMLGWSCAHQVPYNVVDTASPPPPSRAPAGSRALRRESQHNNVPYASRTAVLADATLGTSSAATATKRMAAPANSRVDLGDLTAGSRRSALCWWKKKLGIRAAQSTSGPPGVDPADSPGYGRIWWRSSFRHRGLHRDITRIGRHLLAKTASIPLPNALLQGPQSTRGHGRAVLDDKQRQVHPPRQAGQCRGQNVVGADCGWLVSGRPGYSSRPCIDPPLDLATARPWDDENLRDAAHGVQYISSSFLPG